jgi:hypothetical protein
METIMTNLTTGYTMQYLIDLLEHYNGSSETVALDATDLAIIEDAKEIAKENTND